MEENTRLAKNLAINAKGKLKIDEESSSEDEEDETRYLSYITAEDFETLDQKYFKLNEIANLLASSDLRQRMFALNILTKMVSRQLSEQDANHVYGIVLHPDFVQPCSIVQRIEQLIRTSASRVDLFRMLASFINAALGSIFSDVQSLRLTSLTKQVNSKGLRLF